MLYASDAIVCGCGEQENCGTRSEGAGRGLGARECAPPSPSPPSAFPYHSTNYTPPATGQDALEPPLPPPIPTNTHTLTSSYHRNADLRLNPPSYPDHPEQNPNHNQYASKVQFNSGCPPALSFPLSLVRSCMSREGETGCTAVCNDGLTGVAPCSLCSLPFPPFLLPFSSSVHPHPPTPDNLLSGFDFVSLPRNE